MSFDDLDVLAGALRRSPATVQRSVGRVIRDEAKATRDDAKDIIGGLISGVYLPHYADSITFEVTGLLSAEVGPDSGHPQGGMGRAIEFGSAKHGPLPHMMPAADNVEERLPGKVADAVVQALL